MNKNSKIFVAGHNGLVGSALVKRLKELGYDNIITRNRRDLDLTSEMETKLFFALEMPEYVFDCAAMVGGIAANNTQGADFMLNNLKIQNNIIESCHKFNVKKLLFLGSSCFTPNTMIETMNGQKEIKDICIGDMVLTHKNNYKKVYHLTKKLVNEELIKISTNGWNTISCTKNHEIFTKNRGFIIADNLEKNDILVIPKGKNNKNDLVDILIDNIDKNKYLAYNEMLENINISPTKLSKKYNLSIATIVGWYYNNTKPNIHHIKNNIIDLKDNLSKLCGYYLAEGWISGKKTNKRGSKHNIMLSPGYNEDFANDIKNSFIKVFNLEPTKKLMRTSYKVGYQSNKMIYNFFEQFYLSDVHKAYNKIIPDFILNSSNESIKQFLKGYWRGDGHYTNRKERIGQYLASCSSVSKTMIYQLQKLLLKFNIHSTIYKKPKNRYVKIENRIVFERDSWELKITGKFAIYFIENILDIKLNEKLIKNKSNDPTFDDDFMYINIKKIENIKYNDYVYDLSVEDDISYTANGFAVHNCIYPKNSPQPIKEEYLLTSELEKTNEPYAIAKIAGLKLCEYFKKQYGDNFISVMPTNLYGSSQDNYNKETSHVLPALIRKIHDAKMNNDSSVILWGDGTPLREFLHVNDLANALIFLMNNYDEIETINVGTGTDITIKDLANKIKSIIKYDGEIIWDSSKPNGTMRKLLNCDKIHKLGWNHTINIDEGLKLTYEEFIKNTPRKL
jgi:GDP-L-fucose synthase